MNWSKPEYDHLIEVDQPKHDDDQDVSIPKCSETFPDGDNSAAQSEKEFEERLRETPEKCFGEFEGNTAYNEGGPSDEETYYSDNSRRNSTIDAPVEQTADEPATSSGCCNRFLQVFGCVESPKISPAKYSHTSLDEVQDTQDRILFDDDMPVKQDRDDDEQSWDSSENYDPPQSFEDPYHDDYHEPSNVECPIETYQVIVYDLYNIVHQPIFPSPRNRLVNRIRRCYLFQILCN